jgi:hypothetical protein
MEKVRFINSSELDYVRYIFDRNPWLVGEKLSTEEIENLISEWASQIDRGSLKVNILFGENDEPLAMYTGTIIKNSNQWTVGYTKIANRTSHFSKSAKIMAPALDHMLEYTQSRGLFKFNMIAPEKHHNIRNAIMLKHSKHLHKYIWFDEYVIPKGGFTPLELIYGTNRRPCVWSDVVLRSFNLKQEYRIEYFKQFQYQDYKGSVTSSKGPRPNL